MRKILLLLFMLSINAFAISGFTYPWIIQANDTVTVTRWKGNNDTVQVWGIRVCDTINRAVVHFNNSTLNHDSTVKFVNIDTIRSAPNIDTINGNVVFTGSPSINGKIIGSDTISGVLLKADSATIPILTGNVIVRDALTTDSATIPILTGNVTTRGTQSVDSLASTKGISSTTINTGHGNNELYAMNQDVQTTDSINGLIFNSTRLRADSATIPILTGNVIIRGTQSVDSIVSTKGISSTTLNTGNGNNELYAMDQNVRSTDSINALVFKSTRVRADSATIPKLKGNVGIQTTVKNWSTSFDVLQIGSAASFVSPADSTSNWSTFIGTNLYNDDGNWRAIHSARSNIISMGFGGYNFYTTDSVDADAVVTTTNRMQLDYNGTLKLNPDITTGSASSTPNYLSLGNTYSNGITKDKCKLYLYKNGTDVYGFGIGGNADIQYHVSNTFGTHDFYVNDTLRTRINRDGFSGNLTGNVTGNVSGSSGSTTGNAATVTNGVYTNGTYNDPSWLTGLNTTKLVGTTVSFPCTLFDGASAIATANAKYTIMGNTATVYIESLWGTYAGGGAKINIPTALVPDSSISSRIPIIIRSNSLYEVGHLLYSYAHNYWSIAKADFSDLANGSSGLYASTFTILLR